MRIYLQKRGYAEPQVGDIIQYNTKVTKVSEPVAKDIFKLTFKEEKMPFIESDLENLIIDQIKNKDYEYVYGENLERNYEDIIIEKDLIQFLESKYINEEITKDEITSIISSLKSVSNADLYGANRTGRWAGRIIQLQNLPQNHIEDFKAPTEPP